MKKFVVVIAVIIAMLMAIAGGIVALVCTDYGQQRLKEYAVDMLSDKLNTTVALDSINVSFVHGGVELYGLRVDDRQGVRMAQLDTLLMSFRLKELLNRKVVVTNMICASPIVNVYRTHPDSAANYQFVIDTFKKDKQGDGDDAERDSSRTAFRLKFDMEHLRARVTNVDLRYESRFAGGLVQHGSIGSVRIDVPDNTIETEKIHLSNRRFLRKERLFLAEVESAKINYDALTASIDDVHIEKPGLTVKVKHIYQTERGDIRDLKLGGVDLVTDNGKPHKHQGKETRGWFDAGHLDIHADASLSLLFNPTTFAEGDTIVVTVNSLRGSDKDSGLRADSLSFRLATDLSTATITNFYLRDQSTTVMIPSVKATLPTSDGKTPLSFEAGKVHGCAVLKNIARPFAPALCNFTTPLYFSTAVSGDADHLSFSNVTVKTKDSRLTLNADGGITGLRGGSKALKVRFNVSDMHARNGIKEQIIRHFVYRESLMNLLQSAGNVGYRGTVEIGHKYEHFKGRVTTSLGDINATVHLDETTKYMTCSVASDDFNAGALFNNASLRHLAITADASFDIAGRKAAKMLHRKHGKLPAGWAKGVVKEVKYKFITCRNVTFDLTCDGDVAKGSIDMNKLFLDAKFDFTFTDTQFGKSLKVTPHIHTHNIMKGIQTLIERKKARRAEKRAAKANAQK